MQGIWPEISHATSRTGSEFLLSAWLWVVLPTSSWMLKVLQRQRMVGTQTKGSWSPDDSKEESCPVFLHTTLDSYLVKNELTLKKKKRHPIEAQVKLCLFKFYCLDTWLRFFSLTFLRCAYFHDISYHLVLKKCWRMHSQPLHTVGVVL